MPEEAAENQFEKPLAGKKVVIVGGGVGGIATAFALTDPENKNRPSEVTIYQMGWRLGGKGASGRNMSEGMANRIEEHGLHLWLGMYDNAFRMMRECFNYLQFSHIYNNDHWGKRFKSWQEAFEKEKTVALADDYGGEWDVWAATFPENDRVPGVPDTGDEFSISKFMVQGLTLLRTLVDSLEMRLEQLPPFKGVQTGRRRNEPHTDAEREADRAEEERLIREYSVYLRNLNPLKYKDDIFHFARDGRRTMRTLVIGYLIAAVECWENFPGYRGPLDSGDRARMMGLLDGFIFLFRRWISRLASRDADSRRTWHIIDMLAANLRGIAATGLRGDEDFSRPVKDRKGRVIADLDEKNYTEWLIENGASAESVNSPVVKGLHALTFAYKNGDPSNPQAAAGTALMATSRTFFDYKGSFFWKMNAGMGDTIFAPLYLLLKERGVKFKFFHHLERVAVNEPTDGSRGGSDTVTRLVFARQVDVNSAEIENSVRGEFPGDIADRILETLHEGGNQYEYWPLVTVNELPCWPSEPTWNLLNVQPGHRPDYENFWDTWFPPAVSTSEFDMWDNPLDGVPPEQWVHLNKGVDFDEVVLATSLEPLRFTCEALRKRTDERIDQGLVDTPSWSGMLERVETVQTQALQIWMKKTPAELGWERGPLTLGAFQEPFDTWSDLSHLLKQENWDGEASSLHYFCNVLPTPAGGAPPRHPDWFVRWVTETITPVSQEINQTLPEWAVPRGMPHDAESSSATLVNRITDDPAIADLFANPNQQSADAVRWIFSNHVARWRSSLFAFEEIGRELDALGIQGVSADWIRLLTEEGFDPLSDNGLGLLVDIVNQSAQDLAENGWLETRPEYASYPVERLVSLGVGEGLARALVEIEAQQGPVGPAPESNRLPRIEIIQDPALMARAMDRAGITGSPMDWAQLSGVPRDPVQFADLVSTNSMNVPQDPGEHPYSYWSLACRNAQEFLNETIFNIWPKATFRYPNEFRWDELLSVLDTPGREDAVYRGRLKYQYCRANTSPADRYVQSIPGTTKYRMEPGNTGFDNLTLAGDFTRNGLNMGCVESAVMSGLLAVNALTGVYPNLKTITGLPKIPKCETSNEEETVST